MVDRTKERRMIDSSCRGKTAEAGLLREERETYLEAAGEEKKEREKKGSGWNIYMAGCCGRRKNFQV